MKDASTLLDLLRRQRRLLLATDAASAEAIERGTRELGEAMAAFGAAVRQSAAQGMAAPVDAITAASLKRELDANRAMLAGLAAGNRRALTALFGEQPAYGGPGLVQSTT